MHSFFINFPEILQKNVKKPFKSQVIVDVKQADLQRALGNNARIEDFLN